MWPREGYILVMCLTYLTLICQKAHIRGVHRIGRTARAGASGEAHSFACEDTAFYLPDIEAYTGKAIPRMRH